MVSCGGMAGKWWREKAGLLGEFGGSVGRAIGTWTGFGLLEKEEDDLVDFEEGNGEGLGVGMLWNSDLSPRCQGLSQALSCCSLFSGN